MKIPKTLGKDSLPSLFYWAIASSLSASLLICYPHSASAIFEIIPRRASAVIQELPSLWTSRTPLPALGPIPVEAIQTFPLNHSIDLIPDKLYHDPHFQDSLPYITPQGTVIWEKKKANEQDDSLSALDQREAKLERIQLICKYRNALSHYYFGSPEERYFERTLILKYHVMNDSRVQKLGKYSGPFIAYQHLNGQYYIRNQNLVYRIHDHKNELSHRIEEIIEHHKALLPFDEYMDLSLYDPNFGFYQTIRTIKEHFITSAEQSPGFSAGIVHDLVQRFRRSEKSHLTFVEIGAGSGINLYRILLHLYWQAHAEDAVREEYPLSALGDRSFFQALWSNLSIYVIEAGSALQDTQKEKLSYFLNTNSPKSVGWISNIHQIPRNQENYYYVFGNEIPDAFPAKTFLKINENQYRELTIDFKHSHSSSPEVNLGFDGKIYDEKDPLIQNGLLDTPQDFLTAVPPQKVIPKIDEFFNYSPSWLEFYRGLLEYFESSAFTSVFIDYVRSSAIESSYSKVAGSPLFGFRFYSNGSKIWNEDLAVRSPGFYDITYSPNFNNFLTIARRLGFPHVVIQKQNDYFNKLNQNYYWHGNFHLISTSTIGE